MTTSELRTTAIPDTVCSSSKPKDVLFMVDGSINYQEHWMGRTKQFSEIKSFLKQVISELYEHKFKVGVMKLGGKHGLTLEINFLDGINIPISWLDYMSQRGDSDRRIGEALGTASSKVLVDWFYVYIVIYINVAVSNSGSEGSRKQI